MSAGLGGGGSVGVAFETTMGTYVAPTTFTPILSEELKYTEPKYYSPQIRQQTIVSDVKQSYYHVEGPISMEVDPNFIIYYLYASRHTITKTGVGPYTYKFTPSSAAVVATASGPTTPKTLSITVVRNGVVFGYTGCIVGQYEFMVEDGVLKCNMDVLGIGEASQADPTEAWTTPDLYGADAHRVFVAASAASPTFGAASTNFNGFTFRCNYNAEAQNRLIAARTASYISMGETEATIESELDFEDRTEYDNLKNNSQRAIKLASTNGGSTLAAATDGIELQGNRVSYDTYDIGLAGMADLIMAGFSGKCVGISGGDAYQINLKSAISIT